MTTLYRHRGRVIRKNGKLAVARNCCCDVSGGCCTDYLVFPDSGSDTDATELQIEVTDITAAADACCLDPVADVGATADFTPVAPLFWGCCFLLNDCITGLTLTCGNNELILSWDTDMCIGSPALPLANDAWEHVSTQCDPFEAIFRYTFSQVEPSDCNGWTITVKITKKP